MSDAMDEKSKIEIECSLMETNQSECEDSRTPLDVKQTEEPQTRRQRTSYRSILPSTSLASGEPLADDHPLKSLVEQSDKQLSVKEVLSQKFNLRTRAPHKRFAQGLKTRAFKKMCINNNEVTSVKRMKLQRDTTERTSIQESLGGEFADEYELPPFWKIPVDVKRIQGGYEVDSVKYVSFNLLMHLKQIIIPLESVLPLKINGKILKLTLKELLGHNGIIINDDENMKELQEVLSQSGFLLQNRMYIYLLNVCKENPTIYINDLEPIELSLDHPPFVNCRPNLFMEHLDFAAGSNYIKGDQSEPGSSNSSSPLITTRVLTPRIQLLIAVQLDTSSPVKVVAKNFGVPVETIEQIRSIKQKLFKNSARILVERVNDSCTYSSTDSSPTKLRRNSFVIINILVWRLFKDCVDHKVCLNGKLLREHAVHISAQLGLANFRGSEGWLDGFKRRHKIDLKNMTGVPCSTYEEEHDLEVELEGIREYLKGKCDPIEDIIIQNGNEQSTEVSVASPAPRISIETTGILDLSSLFASGMLNEIKEEPPDEEPPQKVVPESKTRLSLDLKNIEDQSIMENIIRSASIHIQNPVISYCVETLRSYLIRHNPQSIPILVTLQQKLADIANSLSTASDPLGPAPKHL